MVADLERDGHVKNYTIDMVKKNGEIDPPLTFPVLCSKTAQARLSAFSGPGPQSSQKRPTPSYKKRWNAASRSNHPSGNPRAIYRESEEKYRTLYQGFMLCINTVTDAWSAYARFRSEILGRMQGCADEAGKEIDPSSLTGAALLQGIARQGKTL